MTKMKLLAVVTPPSIYHGCSTRKTFWEEKFTCEEKFTLGKFSSGNMGICGRQNVKKYREINDSENYSTLNILLKFDNLNKMITTSSEPKDVVIILSRLLNFNKMVRVE